MVITNPFYSPQVFDKEVVISTTSNKQRVVVSSPKWCPVPFGWELSPDYHFFIVWLEALNGGYISFGENLMKTSDPQWVEFHLRLHFITSETLIFKAAPRQKLMDMCIRDRPSKENLCSIRHHQGYLVVYSVFFCKTPYSMKSCDMKTAWHV